MTVAHGFAAIRQAKKGGRAKPVFFFLFVSDGEWLQADNAWVASSDGGGAMSATSGASGNAVFSAHRLASCRPATVLCSPSSARPTLRFETPTPTAMSPATTSLAA